VGIAEKVLKVRSTCVNAILAASFILTTWHRGLLVDSSDNTCIKGQIRWKKSYRQNYKRHIGYLEKSNLRYLDIAMSVREENFWSLCYQTSRLPTFAWRCGIDINYEVFLLYVIVSLFKPSDHKLKRKSVCIQNVKVLFLAQS